MILPSLYTPNSSQDGFLWCGLGNPGKDYLETRHNAGHMFIDYLLSDTSLTGEYTQKKQKDFKYSLRGNNILLKTDCYMNTSGEYIAKFLNYLKLKDYQFVLIYDDLDLELGSFKLQYDTYPRVHNGVNSVLQHISPKQFFHLRIGINVQDRKQSGEDFVLGRFSAQELELLNGTFRQIATQLTMPANSEQ